ncbi:hypothetical protein [Anaerocolumna chitinilytica]|uniref:Uncharacterized protein n=1 Tax=Anaerocolumna chitinilytica TaxID=1727145 RepID=A0A7I8DL29_9FIRM|nr:hypothetical protein [Anaerocolumna chitinilytica]BCJ98417.1 hypothetical protein bsdcttw_14580 [Anaerocolumna chitinilytica]
MRELIFPLVMIVLCIVAVILMLIYLKRSAKKSENSQKISPEVPQKTAQDFVNVRDINDIFLYNRSGYVISYIKVQSFEKDLLSKNEEKLLTKKLTAAFSELEEDFKFLAVSRPVDITPLVLEYTEMIKNTNNLIRKEVLRNEISVISDFSLSGEVVQREFYYMLWEKQTEDAETDLRKRAKDFSEKLNACGLKAEVIKKPEIIRLCNLINNPAFAAIEDTRTEAVIPILDEY